MAAMHFVVTWLNGHWMSVVLMHTCYCVN